MTMDGCVEKIANALAAHFGHFKRHYDEYRVNYSTIFKAPIKVSDT